MVMRLPHQPAAVCGQFNLHVSLISLQLSEEIIVCEMTVCSTCAQWVFHTNIVMFDHSKIYIFRIKCADTCTEICICTHGLAIGCVAQEDIS